MIFVCQECRSDLDPDTDGLECQVCGAWADPAMFTEPDPDDDYHRRIDERQ